MKIRFEMLAVTAVAALLFAAATAQAEVTLKFGGSQPATGGYMGDTVKTLIESVEKATKGEVKTKAFYAGALSGNEQELAEMTKTGAIDLCNAATTYILGWTPAAKVFDLPYLYEGIGHYQRVIQGEVGDIIKKQAEGNGVKILTYVIPGFRSIFNNVRPINTLEDAKGLKIRAMPSPVYLEMFKSMGMLPTPMPSSELYTSLQLGTVDAGENDPASVVSWGWKDVIKYYSMNQHSLSVNVILMNKARFDKFSPEIQKAFVDAGREAENYQIGYIQDAWTKSMETIKKAGVKVNEIKDIEPFRKSVAHIVDQIDKEIGGGIVQKVRDAAKK